MKKSCQQIIEEIMIEASRAGKTISANDLLKKLDKIDGFWEQALMEDFNVEEIDNKLFN